MEITIKDKKMLVEKCRLKKWLQLSDLYEEISKSKKEKNYSAMIITICSYLELAVGENLWKDFDWYTTASTFIEVCALNVPTVNLPMLLKRDRTSLDQEETLWEYPERSWYLWCNKFARIYHWTEEYIANLDVDTALALMQEIIVDEQLHKEWEWQMTELAYPYNKNTKMCEFHPLPRPVWMEMPRKSNQPKKIRMLKSMMPVGNIVDLTKELPNGTIKP